MTMLRILMAGPWLAAHRLGEALRPPRPALRILMLHDVPPAWTAALAALVARLKDRLVSPIQAEQILDGRLALDGTRYLLSFDDGFASNFEAARDILDPVGAKALFFVCPGLIGQPAEAIAAAIYQGRRPAQEGLMDWSQLEQLVSRGHALGNHTMTHCRLAGLAAPRLEAEVAQAAAAIAARLGPTPWFAYPFGDIQSVDQAALAAIGNHHRFCRSGVRGANRPGIHPLALRSDNVDLASPAVWQSLAISGALDRRYGDAARRLDGLAR